VKRHTKGLQHATQILRSCVVWTSVAAQKELLATAVVDYCIDDNVTGSGTASAATVVVVVRNHGATVQELPAGRAMVAVRHFLMPQRQTRQSCSQFWD